MINVLYSVERGSELEYKFPQLGLISSYEQSKYKDRKYACRFGIQLAKKDFTLSVFHITGQLLVSCSFTTSRVGDRSRI